MVSKLHVIELGGAGGAITAKTADSVPAGSLAYLAADCNPIAQCLS